MPLITKDAHGCARGADPRKIPVAELEQAGHSHRPLLDAIRAKCIDCSGGSISEAAMCTVVNCALWPFRMKANPWRKGRPLDSEKARQLRARQTAKTTP